MIEIKGDNNIINTNIQSQRVDKKSTTKSSKKKSKGIKLTVIIAVIGLLISFWADIYNPLFNNSNTKSKENTSINSSSSIIPRNELLKGIEDSKKKAKESRTLDLKKVIRNSFFQTDYDITIIALSSLDYEIRDNSTEELIHKFLEKNNIEYAEKALELITKPKLRRKLKKKILNHL